jgi:hypothetical protein
MSLVCITVYTLQSLVYIFPVVQQNLYSLIICTCATCSRFWIHFVSTFEAGTHKISDREGYLDQRDTEMLVELHCHSLLTHASHHMLLHLQVRNPLISCT